MYKKVLFSPTRDNKSIKKCSNKIVVAFANAVRSEGRMLTQLWGIWRPPALPLRVGGINGGLINFDLGNI